VPGIEDWLDTAKRLFPDATRADHLAARREAEKGYAEACDFNLNRVKLALANGLSAQEIAQELGLPLTTVEDPQWNSVEHLMRLAHWRREEGNEHTAWWNLALAERRSQARLADTGDQTRVTLTEKGMATAEQLVESEKMDPDILPKPRRSATI
jgi:hypothetical protein